MSHIRIYRWADAPEEYRAVVEERAWLAVVPEGETFDPEADASWVDVTTGEIPGATIVSGTERWA